MSACTCHPDMTGEHDPTCPITKEPSIPTMPRRERGRCVVSHYTSGRCEECKTFQKTPHVTRDLVDDGENLKTIPHLHCAACCPVCAGKEVAA